MRRNAKLAMMWMVLPGLLVPALGAVILGQHGASIPFSSEAGHPALASQLKVVPIPAPTDTMRFTAHALPTRHLVKDLFEPSVNVAADGTIYAAAHAAVVDLVLSCLCGVSRAPAAYSQDDGLTWHELPGPAGVDPVTDNLPGGGMPNGGEGVIASDGTGRAWMLDNAVEQDALYAWCERGTVLCGYDPIAWNVATNGQPLDGCGDGVGGTPDRPWNVFGHGKVLLQNNNGGTPQVAIYDPDTGALAWNDCPVPGAGIGIAGPAAVRASDGAFAIPWIERQGSTSDFTVLLGNVEEGPRLTSTGPLFQVPSAWGQGPCASSNLGDAAFTRSGALFLAKSEDDRSLTIVTSSDLGSFQRTRFLLPAGGNLTFYAISASPVDDGVFLTYADSPSATCQDQFFHAAHLALDAEGFASIRDVTTVTNAPFTYGDYVRNSVGPDGRAYFITQGPATGSAATQTFPLTVWVEDK
ncbi:MAG: hypothetical protein LC624_03970 [Halobacteriales archaeon]|nr:hypothetical protein [Halobacteriales archaeon]